VTPPAVVLAAGRGTRLMRPDPATTLDLEQSRAADLGLKALVPIGGQPYLAYVLQEIAAAGFREVCLVVRGPDDPVARAAREIRPVGLRLAFVHQTDPRGTAHAVLAAESAVDQGPFVVVNGDNLYPAKALAALRGLDGPGLVAFDPVALVRQSNIPGHRLAAFARITARDGRLTGLVEKPDAATARDLAGAGVSMTCWRFDPAIFDFCRAVTPSPRGELELTDAVLLAMASGRPFTVVTMQAGVLDLSERADIPALERLLAGRASVL
jgi:dTDP-glucose pyrophosphorylase